MGLNVERLQRKMTGSTRYGSTQLAICDACGFKTVLAQDNGIVQCPRCGQTMRPHTGMLNKSKPVPTGL